MTTTATAAISQAFDLVNPPGLYDPAPHGYSHVASLAAGARLVLPAGQGGESVDGSLSTDFRAQVRQAFANLQTALRAGGADLADVARTTVLVVDHTEDRLQVLTEEVERAFGPGRKPACTLIPVPRLALDGMLFEVEAVAAVRA